MQLSLSPQITQVGAETGPRVGPSPTLAPARAASPANWHRLTDAAAWDAGLRLLPHPHVLQSWAWGELKSRWGWGAERWRLDDATGSPRAMVQLLRRRVGPLSVWYAPKGPVATDAEAYGAALAFIERRARRTIAIWAKIDGDPLFDWAAGNHDESQSQAALADLRARLVAQGWTPSARQVQFRNTMFTDLRQSDEALLGQMKEKWRYNVRLAGRRGVQVRPANERDHVTLYDMYAETGRRDGFVIRPREYYTDVWAAMHAQAFIAERDGQPLAGLILLCFADRAWYFYGMSKTESREHMPTYALQWHAMRWARDAGFATYDWWGAPEQLDETDTMWGVYRWKQGFGAHLIEGIGAWDYAPSRPLAKLAARFAPSA